MERVFETRELKDILGKTSLSKIIVVALMGCASYPLKICVDHQEYISVLICDEGYIKGVKLYHKSFTTGTNITDWSIQITDKLKAVKKIVLGEIPDGYEADKIMGELEDDGRYILTIITSNKNGIIFLDIMDGKVISWIHDSNTDCPENYCKGGNINT